MSWLTFTWPGLMSVYAGASGGPLQTAEPVDQQLVPVQEAGVPPFFHDLFDFYRSRWVRSVNRNMIISVNTNWQITLELKDPCCTSPCCFLSTHISCLCFSSSGSRCWTGAQPEPRLCPRQLLPGNRRSAGWPREEPKGVVHMWHEEKGAVLYRQSSAGQCIRDWAHSISL